MSHITFAIARTAAVRAVVAIILLISTASARAATPAEVTKAIDKAKEYLYSQHTDGNWERSLEGQGDHGDQKTGYTALVVYALLAAGESPQEERIAAAVEYLKKTPTTGVYALGLRCQVWLLLPQTPETKAMMRKDANILLSSMIKEGPGRGMYDYNPGKKNYSHSRSHYAVLGLWAAAQAGIEVPNTYWATVEKEWIAHQESDGGWNYTKGNRDHPTTPNMTASAVATLFITQEHLHANDGIVCRGSIRSAPIDKGVKWLADNFAKVANDDKSLKRNYPYNTLYGIERVGVAGGYKYLNNIDWFQKGADWLLAKQKPDGSWPPEYGVLTSTSYGVIFLTRGRAPVVLNKLEYAAADGKPGNWNQRPRDAANLARWIGRAAERDLNWQIVNLDVAASELQDAPILYIAGDKELNFSEEQKQKLKLFVESGGMILGNADCQGRGFTNSLRKISTELFPEYEFRELPAAHPIYTEQQFSREKWRIKPSVLGLSNGARELVVLVPQGDPAKSWQLQLVGGREEVWQLGANLVQYAVDKRNLRYKGETHLVARDEKVIPTRKARVARLEYAGNWRPEPGGWARMANVLHNTEKLSLEIVPVKLGTDSLNGFDIAHLTGTTKFTLGTDQQAKLKEFMAGGGTLVIDAAGGSADFAASAEALLGSLFPGKKPERVAADHPMYAAGSQELGPIEFRPYARKNLTGSLDGSPRIQAIEQDGRFVAFYSREDLSVGMVGHPVDGIIGYEPGTATELMSKLILYATSPAKK
jgi:hypothetical protein